MKDSKYYKRLVKNKKKKECNFLSRVLISIILVLLLLIGVNLEPKFGEKIEQVVSNDQFKFYKVREIYDKFIGSFETKDSANDTAMVLNENEEIENVVKEEGRVKISNEGEPVSFLKPGIIVFIGEKENYGNTVIVQGIDGVDIWYGNVSLKDYSLYDYVKSGMYLGTCEGYYYVGIFKDGNYIDYDEYM